jgi:hypothetical protein
MTAAQRPDVAAIVADALAISARYEWGPSWPDKAEQWGAALVDFDGRLPVLARAVGATVPPLPRGHWNRAEREAAIAAIADELPAYEAETLRSLVGRPAP